MSPGGAGLAAIVSIAEAGDRPERPGRNRTGASSKGVGGTRFLRSD